MTPSFRRLAAAAALVVVSWPSVPIAGQMGRNRQVAGCPSTPAAFNSCALAKSKAFQPPRTPDGQPDFQGLWEAPMAGGLGNIEGRGRTEKEYSTGSSTSLVVD